MCIFAHENGHAKNLRQIVADCRLELPKFEVCMCSNGQRGIGENDGANAAEIAECNAFIYKHIRVHSNIPVGLAAGHEGLVHKLKAMTHALSFEHNSVQEMEGHRFCSPKLAVCTEWGIQS